MNGDYTPPLCTAIKLKAGNIHRCRERFCSTCKKRKRNSDTRLLYRKAMTSQAEKNLSCHATQINSIQSTFPF